VDGDLEDVLLGLEKATEFARTYRFEMTEDYLHLIAQVEALPSNRPGSEKGGRWLGRPARKSATRAGDDDRNP
jgi:hypothetical protein